MQGRRRCRGWQPQCTCSSSSGLATPEPLEAANQAACRQPRQYGPATRPDDDQSDHTKDKDEEIPIHRPASVAAVQRGRPALDVAQQLLTVFRMKRPRDLASWVGTASDLLALAILAVMVFGGGLLIGYLAGGIIGSLLR